MRHWRKGQYFLVCSRQLRRVVGFFLFFFFFLHDSCCCEFVFPPFVTCISIPPHI